MLKIKSLRISNIGRFVGDHFIDFSDKSNFIQVDSNNLNTAGSSGGGKSTVFSAIEYVLGLNDIPTTVLQSRLTKSPMSAELIVDKNGEEYRICRHKSEGLSISGNKLDVSGSTKVAEDELDKLFNIPRSLIRPMFHKRQGERGFFLSKTPKQAHEFLMECLGMKSLEIKGERIDAEIKKIESDISAASQAVSVDTATLEATQGVLLNLQEPKCDVSEDVLSQIFKKINELKLSKEQLEKKLEEEISKVPEPEPMSYREDRSIVQMLSKKQDIFQALALEYQDLENTISHLNTNISVNNKHIDIVRTGLQSKPRVSSELEQMKLDIAEAMKKNCPTCKQHINDDAITNDVVMSLVEIAKKKKAELDAIISMENSLPAIILSIEEDKQNLEKVTARQVELDKEMQTCKSEINAINQVRDRRREEAFELYSTAKQAYLKDMESVEAKYDPTIRELEEKIESYNQAYYKGQASLKAHQNAIASYLSQKSSVDAKIVLLKERTQKAQFELSSLQKKLLIVKSAAKLIKSYANQLFQDSLAVVADTATNILSRIPNMSTATLTFDAFKETKSGSIKEEIVPILSMDDEIGVPLKSVSGGERAAVDLAVDLAVIDMIESRTGNGIDLFILDEPFDGLDAICRENCLEVLKNHASDRKILIVDHSTETKQMVQDKIVVVRDGQTSKFSDSL